MYLNLAVREKSWCLFWKFYPGHPAYGQSLYQLCLQQLRPQKEVSWTEPPTSPSSSYVFSFSVLPYVILCSSSHSLHRYVKNDSHVMSCTNDKCSGQDGQAKGGLQVNAVVVRVGEAPSIVIPTFHVISHYGLSVLNNIMIVRCLTSALRLHVGIREVKGYRKCVLLS